MKNIILIISIIILGLSSCQVNRSFSKHRNLYHKSHAKEKIVEEETMQAVEVEMKDSWTKEKEFTQEISLIKTDSIIQKEETKEENVLNLQIPVSRKGKIQKQLQIQREVKKVVQQEKKKAKAMAPSPGLRGEAKEHSVMRTVFVTVLIIALSFAIVAFLFNTFNPIMVLCFAMLIYALLMMQIHVGDFDISYGPEKSGYVNGQWVKYRDVTVTY